MLGTVDGTTTIYIAGVYEYQAGATTHYYEGPTGNVALRRTGHVSNNGVFYLLGDHLGSTSVLVNQNGTLNSSNYYYPYGSNRGGAQSTLTAKRYTGQYHEAGLAGSQGLYYYGARWYDPQLARFAQADTIVPDPTSPQAFNRYMYVAGNPLRFVDPSGHRLEEGAGNVAGGTWSRDGKRAPTQPPPPRFPDRWLFPYLFNEHYGWIDRAHMIPTLAQNIIDKVSRSVSNGGGAVVLPSQETGFSVLGMWVGEYERRYWVSGNVADDQIINVALGIFMDAGERWERWQGELFFGYSEFSIEDLPSNYLGFVRAVKGWNEAETLAHLGNLSARQGHPTCAWSDCSVATPYLFLPKNTGHTPLIKDRDGWKNTSWPDALTITPINSDSGLWKFTGDQSVGWFGWRHNDVGTE